MDERAEQKRGWSTTWPASLAFCLFFVFVVVTQLVYFGHEPIRVIGAVMVCFPVVYFAVLTVKRYRAWSRRRRSTTVQR